MSKLLFFASSVLIFGIVKCHLNLDFYGQEVLEKVQQMNFFNAHQRMKRADDKNMMKSKSQTEDEKAAQKFAELLLGKCTMDCLEKMDPKDKGKSEIKENVKPKRKDNKLGINNIEDYDEKKFEDFCKEYQPSSKCLHGCPKSELMNGLMLDSLALPEVLCVSEYESVKKNAPCLDKFSHLNETADCKQKCKPPSMGIDELLEVNSTDIDDAKAAKVKNALIEACKFGTCSHKCKEPVVVKQCGKPASDLLKKIFSSLLDSINGLMKMGTTFNPKISQEWKTPCKPFEN